MLGDKLTQPKLHEIVAERLTQMIIKGQLLPGDRLPTERELTEQLGVSRGVVREATKLLVAKGLVIVRPGTGMAVADPGSENVTESLSLFLHRQPTGLHHLLELRRCLEVETAGLAAEKASAEDIALLQSQVQQMAQQVADTQTFITADLLFHKQIAVMSQNPLFVAILDSLSDVLLASRRMSVQVENGVRTAQEGHQRICEAIARRDSSSARTQMRAHIEQTSADIQTVIEKQGTAEQTW